MRIANLNCYQKNGNIYLFHAHGYILKCQTRETVDFCSYISEQKYNIFISKFEDQDCYYLTKKAALVTVDRESTIKVPTVNNPASSLSTKPDL